MPWTAHPDCPNNLKEPLERAVNALPVDWLEAPSTGETFDCSEKCERRLHGYALSQGFEVVRCGGGTQTTPTLRFRCTFHGNKTLNTRHLEEAVIRDEDGAILSKRKEEHVSYEGQAANGRSLSATRTG